MKFHRSLLFTANSPSLKWLQGVVEYVTASYTNPALYQIIQEVAKEGLPKKWERLHKRGIRHSMSVTPYTNPNEWFSFEFFLELSYELERDKSQDVDGVKHHGQIADDAGGHLHEVGEAFELLLEKGILTIPYAVMNRDYRLSEDSTHGSQHYHLQKGIALPLIYNNLIYNHLFGFEYIINKYTDSVVKIEVKQGEDVALGTGWFYDVQTSDSQNPIARFVVTNDHVLAGSSSVKVLSKGDEVIPHHSIERLQEKTGVDLAVLRVDYNAAVPAFTLYPSVPLLEEVITIGYPSVPLSQAAYQLVHRGEVNAQVTDYKGQQLLVISARTAPGNSGSPVIDDTGRVVGMVTQELFEKAAFEEKGITPYSACIPAVTLMALLATVS